MRINTLIAAASAPLLALAASKAPSKDAILLSNVKTLTLHKGKKTTHRRISAVPQITSVGGTANGLFEPDVVRCTNAGYDYDPESIQWTCTAALPPEFKLGSTEVICEGYRNSQDDWVLKGSCGLEYRLELTEIGAEKYPDRVKGSWGWGSSSQPYGDHYGDSSGQESGLPATLFWFIFFGIAGWIVWAAFIRDSNWWRGSRGPRLGAADDRRPPGGGGGGGGGGGWWPGSGGDDPPPPPYSRYDQPSKPGPSNANRRGAGWQPGFWTGAAGGAAATYLANSLSGRNSNNNNNTSRFGGYDAGVGPSNSRPTRSSSSQSSYSSTRYESSGFGGTSRR